jgi:hypothetical protein
MTEPIDNLEQRIAQLRVALRQVAGAGDRAQARALRAELQLAEHAWDEALRDIEVQTDQIAPAPAAAREARSLLAIRDQVHQALTLLTAPAALKMVVAVNEAFFARPILGVRLTSLRRDEQRSFDAAPFSRPYYICPALSAAQMSPVRGLLTVSTWPLWQRMIGPLSPRVDFLVAAVAVADQVARLPEPSPAALRLLRQFAVNIPGAVVGRADAVQPEPVAAAVHAELAEYASDREQRESAADRARHQLSTAEQMFGTTGS